MYFEHTATPLRLARAHSSQPLCPSCTAKLTAAEIAGDDGSHVCTECRKHPVGRRIVAETRSRRAPGAGA